MPPSFHSTPSSLLSSTPERRVTHSLSPKAVQLAMAAVAAPNAPRWGSMRQQDVHELLVALMDRLQGEVLEAQRVRRGVVER
jgi:hypothetical protein